jgi:hypothetical protein
MKPTTHELHKIKSYFSSISSRNTQGVSKEVFEQYATNCHLGIRLKNLAYKLWEAITTGSKKNVVSLRNTLTDKLSKKIERVNPKNSNQPFSSGGSNEKSSMVGSANDRLW